MSTGHPACFRRLADIQCPHTMHPFTKEIILLPGSFVANFGLPEADSELSSTVLILEVQDLRCFFRDELQSRCNLTIMDKRALLRLDVGFCKGTALWLVKSSALTGNVHSSPHGVEALLWGPHPKHLFGREMAVDCHQSLKRIQNDNVKDQRHHQ